MKRRIVSIHSCLVALLVSSFATAAPTFKDRKEAQKLAREAKDLSKRGKHKKAAKKFKKADRLVPAPSYKLGLANMLIELGDLVQASEVAAECAGTQARQWVEKKAAANCGKLVGEIDERTPSLEVTVFEPSANDVTVTVDGEEFDPAEGALAFNPGSYQLLATADGYQDFTEQVKLGEGDVTEVEISMIKASGGDGDEADDDAGGGLSPIPAYVSWGVGAVGLGVGIGFGVAAIQTTNEVLRLYGCEAGECPPEAENDLNTAKANGNVSTAGFVVGFTGVIAGTVLFLLSDDDDGADQPNDDDGDDDEGGLLRIEAKPLIGPGFVGVSGSF